MKLYMWKNVLAGYYSCGVMFAIANSIEETKELISPGYSERIVQYNNGIIPEIDDVLAKETPEILDIVPRAFVLQGG